MHFESIKTTERWTKLLFVCLRSEKQRVGSLISRFGPLEWADESDIKILPFPEKFRTRADIVSRQIPRENAADILYKIDELAPPAQGARIIFIGDVPIRISKRSGDIRNSIYVKSCAELEKLLPAILKQATCDWQSRIAKDLTHYHFRLEQQHVETWLQQFDYLGEKWIGEKLLKILDFWPNHRVFDGLFENPVKGITQREWLRGYDLIAFGNPTDGSSAAIISRMLNKGWGSEFASQIRALPMLLEKPPKSKRILFLEDCIMTGQECIDLITKPLATLVKENSIDFKFAVGTAYGIYRVQSFLARNNISDVNVIEPKAGIIANLTPTAMAMARSGNLFDNNGRISISEGRVLTGIAVRSVGILDSNERKNLTWFCRKIGQQLMFHDFQMNAHSAAQASEQAAENSMGFGNLGLVTAFAHSVPDNTLPLFRCGGKVSHGGRQIDWIPLFPHPTTLILHSSQSSSP